MKKIKLAVIYYGNYGQKKVNNQQFRDLTKLLKSFKLFSYDFKDKSKLLADFKKNKIDLVLKNSYGRENENYVEKFLEKNKIPFMGSGSKTTLIGTSKYLSKKIFKKHRLNIAKDIYINKSKWKSSKKVLLNKVEKSIKYPCVVKDVGGTDSRGLYLVNDKLKCIKAVQSILKNNHECLVEEYIKPDSEVTCMVVGDKNPVAYEPVGMGNNDKGSLFKGSRKDKMAFKVEIPTKLPHPLVKKIKNMSVRAHRALGCQTFSRADILIRNKKLYLLELDVHPGFRANSATFLSAKYKKQSPDKLFLKFYDLVINK